MGIGKNWALVEGRKKTLDRQRCLYEDKQLDISQDQIYLVVHFQTSNFPQYFQVKKSQKMKLIGGK